MYVDGAFSSSSSTSVRCSSATRATRRRFRYRARSALVAAERSSAAQSMAAPSATDSSNDSNSSRSGCIELFHETRERPRDGNARGVCVWLAQDHREFLIVVLQFEAPDDGFAIDGTQSLERGFISSHALAPDRNVERRSGFALIGVGQFRRRRTTSESSRFVANAIEHRLTQIRLERAFVTGIELIQPAERIDDRVLNEILGIERAPRGRRQSSASPAAQRRQAAREQAVERAAVPLPY